MNGHPEIDGKGDHPEADGKGDHLMPRAVLESPFAAPRTLRGLVQSIHAQIKYAGERGVWSLQECAKADLAKAQAAVAKAEAIHRRYLKALALHVFDLGFAPYASHALYTQWLDDNDPAQRALGIQAGFAWAQGVTDVFVGVDLGVSPGMELGIGFHKRAGRTIHEVRLGVDWGRAAPRRRPLPGGEGETP